MNDMTEGIFKAITLKTEHSIMRVALEEIAKAEGRYNPDQLEHAGNTIEDMQKLATDALARLAGDPNG